MILKVNIDQHHVTDSRKKVGSKCAIELAMQDKGFNATVIAKCFYLNGDPSNTFDLPPAAIDFIRRFDAGLPCEPLAFEVTI